jgi:dihydrofolate reductase
VVRGDPVSEVKKLKEQEGRDLLIFGHGLLGQTLLKEQLLDRIDLSIHPVIAGWGRLFFREGERAQLKSKSFSKIVKLTYEPQYE